MSSFEFNLGKSLKKIRKNKKLTQAFVAKKAFISRDHYSRIERNYCDIKLNTFIDICLAIGIEPFEFFVFIKKK